MKCTGKEWDTCRVEKMGCTGCYYDEIEVNEYIRTKSGDIFKVDEEKKILQGLKFLDVQYGNIIKHSKDATEMIFEKDIIKYKVNNSNSKIGEVKKFKNAITGKMYLGVEGFGLDQIKVIKLMTKEKFKEEALEIKYEDIKTEV